MARQGTAAGASDRRLRIGNVCLRTRCRASPDLHGTGRCCGRARDARSAGTWHTTASAHHGGTAGSGAFDHSRADQYGSGCTVATAGSALPASPLSAIGYACAATAARCDGAAQGRLRDLRLRRCGHG